MARTAAKAVDDFDVQAAGLRLADLEIAFGAFLRDVETPGEQ